MIIRYWKIGDISHKIARFTSLLLLRPSFEWGGALWCRISQHISSCILLPFILSRRFYRENADFTLHFKIGNLRRLSWDNVQLAHACSLFQNDHFATLSFITSLQERPFRFRGIRTLKTGQVFHRYATGRSDEATNAPVATPVPAARWKWLRNVIEAPFSNNDLAHLRQLGAFAAVDAYSSKTVAFTADELERWIIIHLVLEIP